MDVKRRLTRHTTGTIRVASHPVPHSDIQAKTRSPHCSSSAEATPGSHPASHSQKSCCADSGRARQWPSRAAAAQARSPCSTWSWVGLSKCKIDTNGGSIAPVSSSSSSDTSIQRGPGSWLRRWAAAAPERVPPTGSRTAASADAVVRFRFRSSTPDRPDPAIPSNCATALTVILLTLLVVKYHMGSF